jgi:DNA polymerase III epsilon subunit-like protein
MRFAVVDLETTGMSGQNDRMIEIGIVRVENGCIVDEFSTLVNPERGIPGFISLLTGITDGQVANAPRFYEIAADILGG